MSEISIGKHDTGWKDLGETVKTGKQLGKDLPVDEAVKLATENEGAELLIEKNAGNGSKSYDVYQLEAKGRSMTTLDFIENVVDVKSNTAKKLDGDKAIIATTDADIDLTSFWNIRETKPLGDLKWSFSAIGLNVLSILKDGKPSLPVFLPEIAMNQSIKWEAEDASKNKTDK